MARWRAAARVMALRPHIADDGRCAPTRHFRFLFPHSPTWSGYGQPAEGREASAPGILPSHICQRRANGPPTDVWAKTASAIWSPTRMTGLSAVRVPGKSWPCEGRAVSEDRQGGRRRRSRPSKTTEPEMSACGGSSPMMAREVTLLPEPDSPTRARVSPESSEMEISRTAATGPCGEGNSTVRL